MQSNQSANSNKTAEAPQTIQQSNQQLSSPLSETIGSIQLSSALADPTLPLCHSQIMQLQKTIGNHAVVQLMKSRMQAAQPIQRAAVFEEEPANQMSVQKKENNTGMPDNLKSGLESMSGMEMSDVKVHYNSDKPAQLQALAYAQGNDIHVGPGQEQYLPHEGWHIIQQRQGRVKPTLQMKLGIAVNDDSALETEADVMGAKAVMLGSSETISDRQLDNSPSEGLIQRKHGPKEVMQMVNYVSAATDYWDDDDHSKGVLDDDFDTVISAQLSQPTGYAAVEAAVDASTNIDVVLWRGEKANIAANIVANNSAGGDGADAAVGAPGADEAQQQIGMGSFLPEYTTSTALGYSSGSWLVVVRINTRYLAAGSSAEEGWICSAKAPVVVLDTVDRTIVNSGALAGANAS